MLPIATIGCVPIPPVVARFNRLVTNPLALIVAGRLPPFVVVEHVGRTSARTYTTPVWGFVRGRHLAVALTYGSETDWVRNVLEAGGARIIRLGAARWCGSPRIVRGRSGLSMMPALVRAVLPLFGVDEFLVLEMRSRGRSTPGAVDPYRPPDVLQRG